MKIRASSWGALFDCAHRWEGIHLLGIKSPSSIRAALGTAVHASTAFFDGSRMLGQGITAEESAAIVVDSLREAEIVPDPDLSVRNAQRIGINLHEKYCREVSPRFNFVAVELETKPREIECNGVTIELTGTMDRCRVSANGGKKGIADLKTGLRATSKGVSKTKGHAAQVGVYELLYEHTTGERIDAPAEIIGMSTSGNNEIGSGIITGARDLLIGSHHEPGLIEYAAGMIKSGMYPPNNQSSLCSEKYCPRWSKCRFK